MSVDNDMNRESRLQRRLRRISDELRAIEADIDSAPATGELAESEADLLLDATERLNALAHRAGIARQEARTHDVCELKGLGKELWRSIDVDRHIAEERESWN